MTVIGDALVVLMMEKIRFSANDYAKRHHGGYLGTKSREISRKGLACIYKEVPDFSLLIDSSVCSRLS